MKNFLTVTEIASLFDRHEETIRRWIREGQFTKVKKGPNNMALVSKEEVIQMLNDNHDLTDLPLLNLISKIKIANSYIWPLSSGDNLTRDQLYKITTCPVYSGILYRANTPEISIISSIADANSTDRNPYSDRFEEGYFFYTGEGQTGDQKLTRGNLRLYNAEITKQPIHVFLKKKVNQYIFVGLFEVVGHQTEKQPDTNGYIRDVFVFKLRPIIQEEDNDTAKNLNSDKPKTNEQLIKELFALQNKLKNEKISKNNLTTRYKRSKKLVENLKEVYNHKCQLCDPKNPIPEIITKNSKPYVEVHHIEGFAEILGEDSQSNDNFVVDDINNTICLCPHHHKLLHHYKSKLVFYPEKQAFIAEDNSLILPIYRIHPWHRIGEQTKKS